MWLCVLEWLSVVTSKVGSSAVAASKARQPCPFRQNKAHGVLGCRSQKTKQINEAAQAINSCRLEGLSPSLPQGEHTVGPVQGRGWCGEAGPPTFGLLLRQTLPPTLPPASAASKPRPPPPPSAPPARGRGWLAPWHSWARFSLFSVQTPTLPCKAAPTRGVRGVQGSGSRMGCGPGAFTVSLSSSLTAVSEIIPRKWSSHLATLPSTPSSICPPSPYPLTHWSMALKHWC